MPILPSTTVDPKKGTGVMMICTFGDAADLEWWRSSCLPVRVIIGRDGCMRPLDFCAGDFLSLSPESAGELYSQLQGLSVDESRKRIVGLLATQSGNFGSGPALVGEPEPITHTVKFYEKGDAPVEIVASRQWYVNLLDFKEELRKQVEKIEWHPEHMKTRIQHWIDGMNCDWCISRQRFFGVPFPVWYPISQDGTVEYRNPIFSTDDALPVDPMSDVPPGYSEEDRGKSGGFIGDPDVMDTWATSALTPEIVSRWHLDPNRHASLFPMDLRPQSHDIIRTWTFYTIAKAYLHTGEIPWKHVAISGFILDPDRKKMSKSKGNVVTPRPLLEKYSSDAVRYWAARCRLGIDTVYDEKVVQAGAKLCTKMFNVSRFVLLQLQQAGKLNNLPSVNQICEPLDQAWIARMNKVIERASSRFEKYDYAEALQTTESAFWDFCDHYIELMKERGYGSIGVNEASRNSALVTATHSLKTFLRLFAPFTPYVTDEIWGHCPGRKESEFSVHISSWPSSRETSFDTQIADSSVFDRAVAAISAIRRAKAQAQMSMKVPVERFFATGPVKEIELLASVIPDVIRAGRLMPEGVVLQSVDQPEASLEFRVTLEKSDQ